jgi:hypothetical protein
MLMPSSKNITQRILELLKSATITVGDGRGFVVQGKHNRYIVTCASRLPYSPTYHVYDPEKYKKPPLSLSRIAINIADKIFSMGVPPAPPPEPPSSWTRRPVPLLGHLGEKPNVPARCLYLDPINDLAILGTTDFLYERPVYASFISSVTPLKISDAGKSATVVEETEYETRYEVPVCLLSPKQDLISCTAEYEDGDPPGGVPEVLSLVGGERPRRDALVPDDPIPGHFGNNLAGMLGSPIVMADGS